MDIKEIIKIVNDKKRYQTNDNEEEFYKEVPNVEFELIKEQNEDERRHFTTKESVYRVKENDNIIGLVSARMITNIYSECCDYEDCSNVVKLKEVEAKEKTIIEYVEVK